jgi:hypothetical protein
MIIFGQQDRANRVESSHTFATFVEVTGEGEDKSKHEIESHTISWMPQSMQIRLWGGAERGVNLDLKESLAHAQATRTAVTMWGPFKIKKELYENAVRQEERLKKEDVAYKVLDARLRPNAGSNCIHAVSDIDTERGLLTTGTARGNDASFMIVQHLARWIVEPGDKTNYWLAERLGLGDDIARREVQILMPNSGTK